LDLGRPNGKGYGGAEKGGAPVGSDNDGDDEGGGGGDDLRTLWIDRDKHLRRSKPWADVVGESQQVPHGVDDFSGPEITSWLIQYFLTWGGDPRLWLREWKLEVELRNNDRTMHELTVLIDAFYYAGVVDQVNIPALLCMEVLARRVMTIVDAYATGADKPRWGNSKYYKGSGSIRDGVPTQMKSFIARQVREENEFAVAHARSSGTQGALGAVQTGAGLSGGVDESVLGGGAAVGGDGKDGKKGGGRGAGRRTRGLAATG